MKEMRKEEFLEKLNAKMKSVKIVQNQDAGDIDALKETLIPIVLQEFLDSVPQTLRRGDKLKVQSSGFVVERKFDDIYHIKIDGADVKVGNWRNGLKVLKAEIAMDLSRIVDREVIPCVDDDKMKFYFYW